MDRGPELLWCRVEGRVPRLRISLGPTVRQRREVLGVECLPVRRATHRTGFINRDHWRCLVTTEPRGRDVNFDRQTKLVEPIFGVGEYRRRHVVVHPLNLELRDLRTCNSPHAVVEDLDVQLTDTRSSLPASDDSALARSIAEHCRLRGAEETIHVRELVRSDLERALGGQESETVSSPLQGRLGDLLWRGPLDVHLHLFQLQRGDGLRYEPYVDCVGDCLNALGLRENQPVVKQMRITNHGVVVLCLLQGAIDERARKETGGIDFLKALPVDYEPLPVSRPQTWLLSVGWRRYGLISVREVPGERARRLVT